MLSSWKILLALLVAFMAVCPSQQGALLYRRQSRAGCPDFTTKLDFDATKVRLNNYIGMNLFKF